MLSAPVLVSTLYSDVHFLLVLEFQIPTVDWGIIHKYVTGVTRTTHFIQTFIDESLIAKNGKD